MKLKALFSALILFLLLPTCFFAQQKNKVELDRNQYEFLKQKGKLDPFINYKITESASNSKTKKYVPGKDEVFSSNCSSLPALTYTTSTLTGIDDGTEGPINLPFTFCFYDTSYTSVYINANGNITFGTGQTAFSSTGFPNAFDKMIAPLWADFDGNNNNGTVRLSMGSDFFVVTWDSVGYFYSQGDKRNTCSIVITNGTSTILPAGNNVGFFYENMDWTTGSASGGTNGFGGTAATAGVNKGDGINYIQIGRFDTSGAAFINNTSLHNGVDWLDNKSFFFNLCSQNNIKPVSFNYSDCDTVNMCGINDTLFIDNYFGAPETDQITSITVNSPTLGAHLSTYSNTPGITAHIVNRIVSDASVSGYHTITYTATDDGVPVQSTTVSITLFIPAASTSAPVITSNTAGICANATAIISLNNCANYTNPIWSTGNNSCSISVNSPGLYHVTVSQINGCAQTKSISLQATPTPSPTISADLSYCSSQGSTPIQLLPATVAEPAYSTINWMPGNTSGYSINASSGTYTVTVTGINGCIGDTVFSVQELLTGLSAREDSCMTSSAPAGLYVNLPCISNGVCTVGTCSSSINQDIIQIGQGVDSMYYPTPFMGTWEDGKFQMLLHANELHAMGISQGNLNSLALNILEVNSVDGYADLTIKLLCTNIMEVDSTAFETGAAIVYTDSLFFPIAGWNTFNFFSSYNWDGTSNLMVEFCFNNTAWNGSDIVQKTMVPFKSVISRDEDGSDGCSFTIPDFGWGPDTYRLRPNVRFGYSLAVDTSDYTYSWNLGSPSGPQIATTNFTSVVPPIGQTTYYVTVTDSSGPICSFVDSVTFNVDPNNPQITLQPIPNTVCLNNIITLTTNVTGINSFTLNWLKDGLPLIDNASISGSQTNSLSVSNAQLSDGGWYKCEVIGSCSPGHYTDSVFITVQNCIGLTDHNYTNTFELFPNPANQELNIKLPKSTSAYKEFAITNLLGEIVVSGNIAPKEDLLKIDVQKLDVGFYNITLTRENKKEVKTFIKQ